VARLAGGKLFCCPMQVRPGAGCDFPSHLHVALVDWYVVAQDRASALRIILEQLREQHFTFDELLNPGIHEIDVSAWNEYLASLHGSLRDFLPPAEIVLEYFKAGEGTFHGPFLAAPDG
jgi:hypothetical protein